MKISAFYKEQRDQVQLINVFQAYPNTYRSYGNRDFGKLRNFGVTLEYEFVRNLNILLEYNWRKIKTDIRVPNELKSFFEEGTYNTLNVGLKFNFGSAAFTEKLSF